MGIYSHTCIHTCRITPASLNGNNKNGIKIIQYNNHACMMYRMSTQHCNVFVIVLTTYMHPQTSEPGLRRIEPVSQRWPTIRSDSAREMFLVEQINIALLALSLSHIQWWICTYVRYVSMYIGRYWCVCVCVCNKQCMYILYVYINAPLFLDSWLVLKLGLPSVCLQALGSELGLSGELLPICQQHSLLLPPSAKSITEELWNVASLPFLYCC